MLLENGQQKNRNKTIEKNQKKIEHRKIKENEEKGIKTFFKLSVNIKQRSCVYITFGQNWKYNGFVVCFRFIATLVKKSNTSSKAV